MNPVICYLTKNDQKTVNQLKCSLKLLYKNFNNQFGIPVVIFHEKNFPDKFVINNQFPVEFIEIELKPSISLLPVFEDGLGYPIGYRNMCQFFHSEYYKYLDEYDWFMRLDTDSFIIDKIDYNLFEYLNTNKKIYGYTAEIPEWPPAVKYLETWFESFSAKNNLQTPFYKSLIVDGIYNYRQVYNNFEIVSRRYFDNKMVQYAISEINNSGNIYRWRWGDAPLRTLILSMCYEKCNLHRFSDIGYHHGYFHQKLGKRKCLINNNQPMLDMFNLWEKNNDWIVQ